MNGMWCEREFSVVSFFLSVFGDGIELSEVTVAGNAVVDCGLVQTSPHLVRASFVVVRQHYYKVGGSISACVDKSVPRVQSAGRVDDAKSNPKLLFMTVRRSWGLSCPGL